MLCECCKGRHNISARDVSASFARYNDLPTPPLVIPSVAEGSCGGVGMVERRQNIRSAFAIGQSRLDEKGRGGTNIVGRDVLDAPFYRGVMLLLRECPSSVSLRLPPSPIVQRIQPNLSSLGKAFWLWCDVVTFKKKYIGTNLYFLKFLERVRENLFIKRFSHINKNYFTACSTLALASISLMRFSWLTLVAEAS